MTLIDNGLQMEFIAFIMNRLKSLKKEDLDMILWTILGFGSIDDVKDGTLVGVDRNGNKYYENKRYFVGNL